MNPWHLKSEYGELLPLYNNFFNWTMNHRRDSDIYFPLWRKSSLFDTIVGGKYEVNRLMKLKEYTAVSHLLCL